MLRRSFVSALIAGRAIAQMGAARVFILLGPPGSGKTVQAKNLSKRLKIPAISMSQLLEQEIGRRTSRGKALEASLASGELMSDGPANELVRARLLRPDAGRGFILDGYPASEGQAQALDDFLKEHNFRKPVVVAIDAPEEVLQGRLTERRRADDRQPGNIERRLADYRDAGRTVEKWYGPENLVRVDGRGTPNEVAQRIENAIDQAAMRNGLKTR
jgi:adenylate kinase